MLHLLALIVGLFLSNIDSISIKQGRIITILDWLTTILVIKIFLKVFVKIK